MMFVDEEVLVSERARDLVDRLAQRFQVEEISGIRISQRPDGVPLRELENQPPSPIRLRVRPHDEPRDAELPNGDEGF